MKKINLLPPEQLNNLRLDLLSLQVRQFWLMTGSLLIFLAMFALAAQLYIRSSINSEKAEIAALNNSLQSSDTQELEREVITLNNEIKNIETIKSQQYYWSKALQELGNITPVEILITLLTLNRETGELKI